MGYEIWDLDSGNLWCDFRTLDEALAEVRRAVEQTGADSVGEWSLVRGSYSEPAIIGPDLVALAFNGMPVPAGAGKPPLP
jgi:hypothetical protein